MNKIFTILFFFLIISPNLLLGQKEGPISKIENPHEYFGDERQDWVGKVIFYLRCDHVKVKNPYFDWYYNPYKLDQPKPKREDLLYKYGKIDEVWHGQIWITKPNRSPYWRIRDWKLIEDRQLRKGMNEDMVLISWGEPEKKETQGEKDNVGTEIWTYEGVKERIYFLHFRNGRLKTVRWKDSQ